MGYVLADVMLRFFGVGAFLAPSFGTFWGLARLARPEGSGNSALKFLGVVVLSMTVSGPPPVIQKCVNAAISPVADTL